MNFDGLTMGESALLIAEQGWPVFPCHPETKRPMIKEGFKNASTDPATVEKFWLKFPKAMIGVPMGEKAGLWALDLDAKVTDDGEVIEADDLLAAIVAAVGTDLPPTARSKTPRGGWHIFFRFDPENPVRNRAGVVPHVDVRGEGGYVVVPPSMRADGACYDWIIDPAEGVADAPAALLDLVVRKEEPEPPRRVAVPSGDDRVQKYGLTALNEEINRVRQAGSGTRNSTLYEAALKLGSIVGAGALAEYVAVSSLEGAAHDCGLAREDGIKAVRKTIASGMKNGMADPRDLSFLERPHQSGTSAPQKTGRPAAQSAAPLDPSHASDEMDDAGDGSPAPPVADSDDTDFLCSPHPHAFGKALCETVAECAQLDQNDTDNALRMIRHFGEDILYIRHNGWCVFNDTHFVREGGEELIAIRAQETARRIKLEAAYVGYTPAELKILEAAEPLTEIDEGDLTEQQREILIAAGSVKKNLGSRRAARKKFAITSGNGGRIRAMVDQAVPHKSVAVEETDCDPLTFNVQNGTLRFEKVEDPENPDPDGKRYKLKVTLDEHSRDDRLTKCAPVKYDPEAKCPKWMEFLDLFQPELQQREFLQVYHGLGLTGLTDEQVLVFNYGDGANGKSTFIEFICWLMGEYAATLNPESVTGQGQRRGDQATPDLADLPGKRLVRISELPRGEDLKEDLIKQLTGGEPMKVRALHKDFYEFRPIFKATMSGNDKPVIKGGDHGIWRRIRLVLWAVRISDEMKRPMQEVLAEFRAEASGILNWLIEGLDIYFQRGLVAPESVVSATAEYREEMDPVQSFLDACVTLNEPGERVRASDMYTIYLAWCKANSIRAFSQTNFGKMLTKKGIKRERGRIIHYLDIRLQVSVQTFEPEPSFHPGPDEDD